LIDVSNRHPRFFEEGEETASHLYEVVEEVEILPSLDWTGPDLPADGVAGENLCVESEA